MSASPLSRPIASLMRATFAVPVEDTLIVAAQKLRENGSELLPVCDGPFLRGVVSESSLARALADGAEEIAGVEQALLHPEPTIHHYESGAEALRRFEEFGVGTLVVVDDDRRVVGLLRASDLVNPPKAVVRPQAIGGMATPFGVYLTSGVVRAGAGDLALVTTGMLLFTVLSTATVIAYYFERWLLHFHLPAGLIGTISSVLQLALFAGGFRILPISGIHAAEHMVVHAIERGEPLIPSVVRRMPRVHPRCGTNLAAGASIFLGVITWKVIPVEEFRYLLALVLTLLFWRPLGSLMQYWITTKPPSDKQIQMGIRSGEQLLKKQSQAHKLGTNLFMRILSSGMLHVMLGSAIALGLISLLAKVLPFEIPF